MFLITMKFNKLGCEANSKSLFVFVLTARRLREKALPDEFRPEGSVPESRHIVSEAGKGGYGAVFAPSRAADFCVGLP
jgi:hypothetical protein